MPRALTISKIDGKPGQVYYPLTLIDQPTPDPQPNQVVVRISAAALNHRDLFIRQHLYPGTAFGVPLLADGCGVVTATGASDAARRWQGKRVVLNPGTGWRDDPAGPERGVYALMGGTAFNANGTAAEFVCVDAGELEEAPAHLSAVEAAALPLAGLTAWRAVVTKSGAAGKGKNILVTGIGGGVAVFALLLGTAMGANVYVSSGSAAKIGKAMALGAKGGVNYHSKDWDKALKSMLPKDRPQLDAIIDGAGGNIVEKAVKLLKVGGVISQYGMTVSPKMTWNMGAVMKNVELRGVMMGSRKEFADLIKFVNEKKLKPLVSRTVTGLDNLPAIDSLFEDMKKGSQLGKLVIEITSEKKEKKGKSKL